MITLVDWQAAIHAAQIVTGTQHWRLEAKVGEYPDESEAAAVYRSLDCAEITLNTHENNGVEPGRDLVELAIHEIMHMKLAAIKYYTVNPATTEFMCDEAALVYRRTRDLREVITP